MQVRRGVGAIPYPGSVCCRFCTGSRLCVASDALLCCAPATTAGEIGNASPMLRLPVVMSTTLGTLLAGLVVAGLLHFPATCRCGADLPHSHSLFQLAGRHHDHRSHAHAPHDHSQGQPPARAGAPLDIDGPVVTTPGSSGSETSALIATSQSAPQARGRRLRRRRPARDRGIRGRVVAPETMPPRPLR